ncbi:MAG: DUF2442 domain-containing protein [Gemmatimonadetes bacterium]|nr:DUF2442 domain-containing protein [Gemmatimonadota bacterium]MYC73625.1 DUF2442 domain-containing protein [Gemmatimonadota bacterium]MYI62700.1 DUF2442 domain-containing protein [Gemmatimonadota bacterium]
MNSERLGKIASDVEVTNISTHGIWLLVDEREFFLSYEDFPWFKEVPIGNILRVEQPTPGHFYWPDLDVDLSIESIEHPERFPLKAKVSQERG